MQATITRIGNPAWIASAILLACSGGPATPTDGSMPSGDGGHPAEDGGHPGEDGGPVTPPGTFPAGWLFTRDNHIFVSDGSASGGTDQWMGRGVNIDDLFLCGRNNTLSNSMAEEQLITMLSHLMPEWGPNFLRISLGMASFPTVASWTDTDGSDYRTPMENIIHAAGGYPNTYVLVTLRSDATMTGLDTMHGDPEATGIPTPDTDPVYIGMVDSFAHDSYVLFGLTNEPGGNLLDDTVIAASMQHAVATIRAEEDRLGVPHHIITVQGQSWTSVLDYYDSYPINGDNVVYEVHGYPPSTDSYTHSLPMLIGEYGGVPGDGAAFFADLESKHISNIAWIFDPFSGCGPDLVNVTSDLTMIEANPEGGGPLVQAYLLAHAP